ncbi:MAG: tyrosine--tRNA ligase [Cyanobacteria bacterium P01_H01_bin.74]
MTYPPNCSGTSDNSSNKVAHQIFIKQAEMLCSGAELLPNGTEELARRLQKATESNQPLNIKLGLDPTRPDLHLGHAVVLKKLRLFQDLGHQAILIIGDATAMIGDPSGKSATRPALSEEAVNQNAETYLAQAGKIIDVEKASIVRNSQWLSEMNLASFLKLAAHATVAQIIARDDFAKRLSEKKPISLHELFYPLMQGYDSVMVNADLELGGTDQRFNNLMGRALQQAYDSKPDSQLVLLMPLLEGTDGKIKMSKSYPDHCINLTDLPNEMFGKIMSIPDPLITRYELLLGLLTQEQVSQQEQQLASGQINPRDLKLWLAKFLIRIYYGETEAETAEQYFINTFQKKDIPDTMDEIALSAAQAVDLVKVLVENGLAPSRNEARRLIQGGGVKVDSEKVAAIDRQLHASPADSTVIQVGKRKFLKIVWTQ